MSSFLFSECLKPQRSRSVTFEKPIRYNILYLTINLQLTDVAKLRKQSERAFLNALRSVGFADAGFSALIIKILSYFR